MYLEPPSVIFLTLNFHRNLWVIAQKTFSHILSTKLDPHCRLPRGQDRTWVQIQESNLNMDSSAQLPGRASYWISISLISFTCKLGSIILTSQNVCENWGRWQKPKSQANTGYSVWPAFFSWHQSLPPDSACIEFAATALWEASWLSGHMVHTWQPLPRTEVGWRLSQLVSTWLGCLTGPASAVGSGTWF